MTAMPADLTQHSFDRILIIKPSSLGDVIHALPILEGLRKRFPSARISWLVSTTLADLIDGHPALDEVIPFDRKHYGKLGRNLRASVDFLRYVVELRKRRFDLVIDLQGLFRSGFFARATGAGARIGPARTREFAWIFYNRHVDRTPETIHAVDAIWPVAHMLGFGDAPKVFRLPICNDDRAEVAKLLHSAGLADGADYAVVFPGARWETKVWPAERFAEVIDRLSTDHNLPSVLAGSASDRATCQTVAGACHAEPRPIDLSGKTSLREAAALIEGARLAVTNDSGPMHLADAVGCPLVAVLGPTSPDRTGPYRQRDGVVRVEVPCSPCRRKRLPKCPESHVCMNELNVERVLAALDRKLTASAGRPDMDMGVR